METILIKTENSKTGETHKVVLNLSQRLDLKTCCYSKLIHLLHMEKYKKAV